MTLQAFSHALLEQAINRYLDLDPRTREALARLHGRVIAFELLGLGQTLYLIPGPAGVQLLADYAGEPDCTLRGTPLALARMADRRASGEQLFGGEVAIDGDTELAHRFGNILAGVDIDWEEQLSRYTGDLVAHRLGGLARDARRWAGGTLRSLQLDLGEYLQHELQLLPVRDEIEQFLGEVDRLRDDVERLQARVDRLERNRR